MWHTRHRPASSSPSYYHAYAYDSKHDCEARVVEAKKKREVEKAYETAKKKLESLSREEVRERYGGKWW